MSNNLCLNNLLVSQKKCNKSKVIYVSQSSKNIRQGKHLIKLGLIYSDSYYYFKSLIISSCEKLIRSNCDCIADGISSEIDHALRVSCKYARINHETSREIKLHNDRSSPLLIRDALLLAKIRRTAFRGDWRLGG